MSLERDKSLITGRPKRAAARLNFVGGVPVLQSGYKPGQGADRKLREPTQRLNRPRREPRKRNTRRCRQASSDQFDIPSADDLLSEHTSHGETGPKLPSPDRNTQEASVRVKCEPSAAERSLQARDDSSDATPDLVKATVLLLHEYIGPPHQDLHEAEQRLGQIGQHASTQTEDVFEREVRALHDQLKLKDYEATCQRQALQGQIDCVRGQLTMQRADHDGQLQRSREEVAEQAQRLTLQRDEIGRLNAILQQSRKDITELAVKLAMTKGPIRPNTSSLRDALLELNVSSRLVNRLVEEPDLLDELCLKDGVENCIQWPEDDDTLLLIRSSVTSLNGRRGSTRNEQRGEAPPRLQCMGHTMPGTIFLRQSPTRPDAEVKRAPAPKRQARQGPSPVTRSAAFRAAARRAMSSQSSAEGSGAGRSVPECDPYDRLQQLVASLT